MQDAQYYFNLVHDAYEGRNGTQDESYEILMQLAEITMTQEERERMMKDVLTSRISGRSGLMRIAHAVLRRKQEIDQNRRPIDRSSIQF